jgi:hypothetical protein
MPEPVSLLTTVAPAIVDGLFKTFGGLLAPSQRKKDKWSREHSLKLGQQRMSAVNANMKPDTPYFNMAKGAAPMYEMMNKLLAGKANMYMGGGNQGQSWGVNFPQVIQELSAPRNMGGGGGGGNPMGMPSGWQNKQDPTMPPWATTMKP